MSYKLDIDKRVHWGSIYEAYGSLLNSKEPFMLKKVLEWQKRTILA